MTFGLKMGIAICLLAVGTTSAGLLYFYNMTYQYVWKEMANRLKDIGRTGQFLLTEEHRKIIIKLDEKTNQLSLARDEKLLNIEPGNTAQSLEPGQVEEIQHSKEFLMIGQVMREIKKASKPKVTPINIPLSQIDEAGDEPTIRYVYIFTAIAESPDHHLAKFIVDGDYEVLDQNGNGKIDDDEQATEVGMIYNVSKQPGALKAFKGEVAANDEYYVDKWGTLMSAYVPIMQDGKVIAVMGIDMSASSQFNLLQTLKWICIAVIATSFLLSIVISFFIARLLARPIVKLREGAERVKNRDYSTVVDVHSNDELGVLAATFNEMVAEVREHSQTLEQKVAARTAELQKTLETVQALKSQQDADYYLTNLLANPLFKNYNKSKMIETQFYVKQKKEFQFRNRPGELGGDMCVTGNLKFHGARYTMFVNGDAMGKSMQGAGGALIMGSVVNSIMSRSASNKRDLDITPAQWLEETYKEIHDVFVTFDGSMYVSCIMGLINDENGLMMYFNAEHPAAVLYRSGHASFLDEDIFLRKLGSQIQGEFKIHSLQLQPGDYVFVASDGRDDINLTPGAETRTINEDEHLFLRLVEQANGELTEIVHLVQQKGEITDDISMIRIAYKPASSGEAATAANVSFSSSDVIHLMKEKKYADALGRMGNPESDGALMLYYRGLCLERLGRENEALPFLERAIRMDEEHVAALKLLGSVFFKIGQYKESAESLERALHLRPDEEKLKTALDRVKRRLSAEAI